MPKGHPNKRYTPEFKIKVVETMHNERLSYKETARQFDIPQGHKTVAKWERIYLEEGKDGLYVERRGRKSIGRPPKLKKEVEEDLTSEVQRLRAENAYLKNRMPWLPRGYGKRKSTSDMGTKARIQNMAAHRYCQDSSQHILLLQQTI